MTFIFSVVILYLMAVLESMLLVVLCQQVAQQ